MVLLLGGTGYIGRAFVAELRRREWAFRVVSRNECDYTSFNGLVGLLRQSRPTFLINAAGFTGKPNVDVCEVHRAETLLGNSLLPSTISHACAINGIPWGHVSSGCIYSGARVSREGSIVEEKDLSRPALRKLFDETPDSFHGFSETDEPNFSFRRPPCSFYSGTKALGEEAVTGGGGAYIWRLRIPFDEHDDQRNYLSKLQRYPKVYDNINSISHRGEFVRACLELWDKRAPFGIYNVTNRGAITARRVVELIRQIRPSSRQFEFWTSDAEFYSSAATAPRSNCILDTSKLLQAGVAMRTVEEAVEDSLRQWRTSSETSTA